MIVLVLQHHIPSRACYKTLFLLCAICDIEQKINSLFPIHFLVVRSFSSRYFCSLIILWAEWHRWFKTLVWILIHTNTYCSILCFVHCYGQTCISVLIQIVQVLTQVYIFRLPLFRCSSFTYFLHFLCSKSSASHRSSFSLRVVKLFICHPWHMCNLDTDFWLMSWVLANS